MKIALVGHGSMGRLIERLAIEAGHEIVCVVTEDQADLPAESLSRQLGGADVAIDFTTAAAVRRNAEACVAAHVPLVEGTTGWHHQVDDIERAVRDGSGCCVYGANFSIGVNLFYRLVDRAAELFAKFDDYDAFIEEQHHSRKKDAPSGTAVKLKDIVAGHIKRDFTVTSTRAGNIPGTHRIGFDGPSDQVLLQHTARSRDGFALGALMAAEWVVGKTGFFEFSDVVDEILNGNDRIAA